MATAPVDEVVPMLFRMGPANSAVHTALATGADFGAAVCRKSIGISTDEQPATWPSARKVYIFRSAPWTQAEFQEVEKELQAD